MKVFKRNHKHVYRIYKELRLNLRIKHRKRLVREKPEAMTVALGINQVWSIDIMYDRLEDERTFRFLNVINDFNSKAIGMEIDFSLPSERVIRKLKQIILWRDKPEVIRYDNNPEYISAAIKIWAHEIGIRLEYIQLGNPQQNAYVERLETLEHACRLIENWIGFYNQRRPHQALKMLTPNQAFELFKLAA